MNKLEDRSIDILPHSQGPGAVYYGGFGSCPSQECFDQEGSGSFEESVRMSTV